MQGLFMNGSIMERGLQAFCWMLIHSLWQGLLLAIITGMMLLLTRNARAATRYAMMTILGLLFLLACGGTFMYAWSNSGTAASPSPVTGRFTGFAVLQDDGMDQFLAMLSRFCSDQAVFIVGVWFVIFCLRCWQMSRALRVVRRIRTSGHQDPGLYWKDKIKTLAQQLHIKKTVTLLETGISRIPVVIGHAKPVIYMPLGLLANLPPDQVEAVLLHELAHIRRNDYLVNLLQSLAETIFFFNPGLLWVSSLLKQEREHCCDDVALTHTGNKKPFIQALISFKEYSLQGKSYAMGFPGRKSYLLHRVTRIIDNRNQALSGGEKIFLLGSLLICLILLVTRAHKKQQPIEANVLVKPGNVPVSGEKTGTWINTQTVKQAVQRKPALPASKQSRQRVEQKANLQGISHQQPLAAVAAEQQAVNEKQPAERTAAQIVIEQPDKQAVQRTIRDREQAKLARQQAAKDYLQAEMNRQLAEKHREQAEREREIAMKHREHAERDREQATLQREQAEKDRLRAAYDRQQAELQRQQAERDRKQAEYHRKQLIEKYKTSTEYSHSINVRTL